MDTVSRGYEYLIQRGLTKDTIERAGLTYNDQANEIRIPYRDYFGRERGARIRKLSGDPKYRAERSGGGSHIFNVRALQFDPVYITEGEFDCLVLGQLGFKAVGIPGAAAFKGHWRWLFAGKEVRIVFDGDIAGRNGSANLSQELDGLAGSVTRIELPTGEDINSLYLRDWEYLVGLLRS